MTALLEAHDISVSYGGIDAVQGASLTIDAGQIATVIGPNGAGKTTLLNAVMGIVPARGRIVFAGADTTRLPVEARVRLGLSLVPEKRELFPTMSVDDNLQLGGFRHRHEGVRALRRATEGIYDLFPRLRERRRQQAGTLSGGERQMLALGRALMGRPRLLMLDEPSLGLAPLLVAEMLRIVSELRRGDCAILLVEQNARAALSISDYGYVLEMGRITLQGPGAALANDDRVVQTYLGAEPTLGEESRPARTTRPAADPRAGHLR